MIKNAKNQLLEVLQNLGCTEDCATFSESNCSSSARRRTVTVIFPDGREVSATGEGYRNSDADIAAAQFALDQLRSEHSDLLVDWDEIFSQAQAGDALIKLSVYLAAGLTNASDRSQLLQRMESDLHLARLFDLWRSQGDPDLAIWGPKLGEKRKATLVESLLWQRFGERVLTPNAATQFEPMLKTLVIENY